MDERDYKKTYEKLNFKNILGVKKLNEKMRDKKLRYFRHEWRSEERIVCKRVTEMKVGRRLWGGQMEELSMILRKA